MGNTEQNQFSKDRDATVLACLRENESRALEFGICPSVFSALRVEFLRVMQERDEISASMEVNLFRTDVTNR